MTKPLQNKMIDSYKPIRIPVEGGAGVSVLTHGLNSPSPASVIAATLNP